MMTRAMLTLSLLLPVALDAAIHDSAVLLASDAQSLTQRKAKLDRAKEDKEEVQKPAAPAAAPASSPMASAPVAAEKESTEESEKKSKKASKKTSKKESNEAADDDLAPEDVPFSDVEPFGRESRAQKLTEDSIKESNKMVDQIEKAEVAETKRSVFRALTRLRGAAISSFDGIANAQQANIDQYAEENAYLENHDVKHLANEESDVSKWAFPSNADFL
eukprot:TRINITY_DN28405_c0_g1_i1.p1 TRINITY_DN28405_c0_g1~~TRINITY_DN28405_c0_g1_i1.p1  ORF type:complete len:219 (+),score=77.02 TRINITY_DN28405_c0_g1_i1:84-740(+)